MTPRGRSTWPTPTWPAWSGTSSRRHSGWDRRSIDATRGDPMPVMRPRADRTAAARFDRHRGTRQRAIHPSLEPFEPRMLPSGGAHPIRHLLSKIAYVTNWKSNDIGALRLNRNGSLQGPPRVFPVVVGALNPLVVAP